MQVRIRRGGPSGAPTRHFRAATLVTALLLSLLAACGSGGSTSTGAAPSSGSSGGGAGGGTDLRLVTTATAASLPMFIAQDEGMFAKHGLNTTLQFTENLTNIPAILGRQYDIGIGVQPVLIRAATSGIDVVEISGNERVTKDNPTILVVARPNAGITTPADLKGKRMAAPTIAGNINLATLYWLKQQGIDPGSVNVVQVNTPNMPDQLAAGQIDAAEVQEPFASILLRQGYVNVGYPLDAVANPAPMANWIANGEWAKSHLDEIGKYKAALQDAIDFIGSDPDRSYEILAKYTGTKVDVAKDIPLAIFTVETSVNDLQPWDKVLRSVSDFSKDVDYNSLIVTAPPSS